jgi:hypothetical protein
MRYCWRNLKACTYGPHGLPHWSGLPLAVGLALYIPQFFGTQPIWVAHGMLVATGCLSLAVALWRDSRG